MTAVLAAALPIGTAIQGGTYVGSVRIGDQVYGIVVAPKATGETEGEWLSKYESVPGATSFVDGAANTAAMAFAGSELATWAQGLDIGGHTDWYLPARDELELAYRHLKPTTDSNWVWRHGDNPSSVPAGYPYTETSPAQTTVSGFALGQPEAFERAWYWTSTQYSAGYAWVQDFEVGYQGTGGKDDRYRARAVRRFLIN